MNVGRRPRARRLRSAAGSINSGRHILESRCAERCANDVFSTSFRATLTEVSSFALSDFVTEGETILDASLAIVFTNGLKYFTKPFRSIVIGRSGSPGLCTFGEPYIWGRYEPDGEVLVYTFT